MAGGATNSSVRERNGGKRRVQWNNQQTGTPQPNETAKRRYGPKL